MAGFNGRAALFYEDNASSGTLRALVFSEIGAGAASSVVVQSGIAINHVAAKASVGNNGLVVAYTDVAADLIRVATADTNMNFTLRASIPTTAANTIGTVEVAKVDLSQGRIVISWREYTAGDPRTDSIRAVESTNFGASWGPVFTMLSGTSSTTSQFADYNIGNTTLSGSNNGAFSVLARTTEANEFQNRPSNLWLTVTGTSHSTSPSSVTYVDLKLDSEKVDERTVDAFGNADGHYLVYRAETLDGTTAKLRFAYCFADCHLFSSWDRSLIKVWTSFVSNQGRFAGMTVAQTSSAAFDPAVYVLYQEVQGTTRYFKVLSRGVHRRTR
jgi:hypothetical protein